MEGPILAQGDGAFFIGDYMSEKKSKHPGGRPSDYTPEIALEICRQLVEGSSLRSITRSESMPSIPTVYSWFKKHPEFLKQYQQAKEDQIDTFADEIIEISDDGTNDFVEKINKKTGEVYVVVDHEHINRSRLRVDTRKWVCERMKPKKYGPKSEIDIGGQKNNPLQVQDISKLTDKELQAYLQAQIGSQKGGES